MTKGKSLNNGRNKDEENNNNQYFREGAVKSKFSIKLHIKYWRDSQARAQSLSIRPVRVQKVFYADF